MAAATAEHRKLWSPGRIWRDGGHLPSMVDLPLGMFAMGEREDDKFASDLERPAHQVEIAHPIAMGRFPVTAAEYAVFTGKTSPDEGALPVVGVSWEDAVSYCDWLADATGGSYRLPTEAEWEYACCAGQRNSFPHGEVLTPADANYLYDEHGRKVGPGRRTPVGAYPPNAFRLYDMVGNVCEWVSDAWHSTFTGAPVEGESWGGKAEAGLRVIRGGAWDYLPRLLRCVWRDCLHQQTRRDNVGFRVACTMS